MTQPHGSQPDSRANQVDRRIRVSWPAVLVSILLISLIAAVTYASSAVYSWARDTARTLPDVHPVVSPPRVTLPDSAGEIEVSPSGAQLETATLRDTTSLELPAQIQQPGSAERITFLLLGVDQRPNDPSPPRTDNMILVTVEPNTGDVGMISLPRDLYVPIPGFERSGKINTAYVIGESRDYPGGGGSLAKKTVGEFLGYPIDYYIAINFNGFEELVDMLGGIDVEVPKTIHDELYPTIDYGYQTFHIDAGYQHLDGSTALKYVRTRNTDNDFERARRQQQVLLAIKDKILENKLLATLRVFEFLDVLTDAIAHDIPASQLPELVALARRVQINDIDQLVLDNRFATIDADSSQGWILIPDRAKIRPAVDSIFATEAPTPQIDLAAVARQQARQEAELARQQVRNDFHAQAEALRDGLGQEDARLIVLNGTSDPVLAARAADWLQRLGYQVVAFGQADSTDYPRTVLVVHQDNKPFTVSQLRDTFAIADKNIRESDGTTDDADLRLIIGRDFYLLVSN